MIADHFSPATQQWAGAQHRCFSAWFRNARGLADHLGCELQFRKADRDVGPDGKDDLASWK